MQCLSLITLENAYIIRWAITVYLITGKESGFFRHAIGVSLHAIKTR